MKKLSLILFLVTISSQAFNLPVVGVGSSGRKHEAYEEMKSWCDKNDGFLEGYICRRVNKNLNCTTNTYVCSGVCKVGEQVDVVEEALINSQAIDYSKY